MWKGLKYSLSDLCFFLSLFIMFLSPLPCVDGVRSFSTLCISRMSRGHAENHSDKIVVQFTTILHSYIPLPVTYSRKPLIDISLLPFPPSILQGPVIFILAQKSVSASKTALYSHFSCSPSPCLSIYAYYWFREVRFWNRYAPLDIHEKAREI